MPMDNTVPDRVPSSVGMFVSFGQIYECISTPLEVGFGLGREPRARVEEFYRMSVEEWARQRWTSLIQSTLHLNANSVEVALHPFLPPMGNAPRGDRELPQWWEEAVHEQAKFEAECAIARTTPIGESSCVTMNWEAIDWWAFNFHMPPAIIDAVEAFGSDNWGCPRVIQTLQPPFPDFSSFYAFL